MRLDLLLDVVCFEAGYYNTEKAGQGIWLWIYYEMWCVLKQVIPKKYDREWDCWFITRYGVFRSRLLQYRKKYDNGNETVDLLLDVGHVFSSRALQERKAMADDETFSGQEPCSIMWNQTAVY